jgi:hypothetical protein
MVKNIPTIERSTKIRFGKYATDDQAENTIVFNASNAAIDASTAGGVYMTPLRQATIGGATFIGYDSTTKEIVDTTVLTSLLGGISLDDVTKEGNVVSNGIPHFANVTTAFTTLPGSNVGISNTNPQHLLSVSDTVFFSNTGEETIKVEGNVRAQRFFSGTQVTIDSAAIDSKLVVSGKIKTTSLESTGAIGISNNNTLTKKLSIGSHTFVDDPATTGNTITTSGNVSAAFYHGDSYYLSNLNLNNIVLQGNTTASRTVQFNYANGPALITNGNVGIQNTYGIHTLDVGSNLFVDDIGSDILNVTGNVNATNYLKSKRLEVSEDAIISGNLTVEGTTTFIDTINTVFKDSIISLANNNPSASTDIGIIMQQPNSNANPTVTFRGDENEMMIGYTLNSASDTEIVPDLSNVIDLHVYGNIIAQNNLTLTSGELTAITLNGNVNASGNIETTSGFFKGDGGILSNVTLQQVTDAGNTTSNTVLFTNAHTAFTTDLTSNVGVKLDQLSNVNVTGLVEDNILIYDGSNWVNDYNVHNFVKIKNETGDTLYRGNTVYIVDGHNANVANVALAKSDSPNTMPCIGVIHDDILDQNEGVAVAYGKVQNVNTDGFTEGEIVYVSNTNAGSVMSSKPFGASDLIQNVGICVKSDLSHGVIFVTGVGRSNDIPNAEEVYAQPTYVYVNSSGNELKKILASNLSANNQTLDMVTSWSNSTQNTIQSTHATTGFISSGNVHVGSNIFVSGIKDTSDTGLSYIPMIEKGTGKLIRSPAYVDNDDTYIINAANAEFTGNLSFTGNTYVFESNTVVINDRILGIANNNTSHTLDVGIIMEHPGHNIAFIHHGAPVEGDPHEHEMVLGYTQNTVSDNHVLDDANIITFRVLGNIIAQNNLTLTSGDLTAITVNSNVVGDNVSVITLNGNVVGNNVDVITLNGNVSGDNVSVITLNGNVVGNNVDVITLNGNVSGDNVSVITLNGNVVSDNVVATNAIYGEISGSNAISASIISVTDSLTSITTSGNVVISGNVTATKFIGDGGTLSNIQTATPTLASVVDEGNVTSNVVRFANVTTGIEITSNIDFTNKITLKSTSVTKSNLFVVNAIQLDPSYASPSRNVLSYNTTTGEIYDSGGLGGSLFDNISEEGANVALGSNLTINSFGSNVLTVSGNVSADNITIGGVVTNVVTANTITVSGNITSQNIKLTNTDITASVTSGTITVDAKEKTYGTAPLVVSTTDVSNLVFSNLITGAQIVIPILASGGDISISKELTNVNFYAMTSDVSVTQDKHALMTLSNLYGNIYMNAIGFA